MSTKAPKTDLWYPFFVGDYRRDTARLSCEQHGAYRQLIDEYWITGPLPDEDEILARIVGLDLKQWRKNRPVLERFFRVNKGVWKHKKIDTLLADAGARKTKAEQRARTAANARWGGGSDKARNATSNATSMPQALLEECPPPSPSSTDSQIVLFPEPKEITQPLLSADSAPKRGARLKDNWNPSADNRAYAIEQGFSEREVDSLAEDFRDYWTAASGQGAIKLDWSAAWRRWVRTTMEKRATRPASTKRVGWV